MFIHFYFKDAYLKGYITRKMKYQPNVPIKRDFIGI